MVAPKSGLMCECEIVKNLMPQPVFVWKHVLRCCSRVDKTLSCPLGKSNFRGVNETVVNKIEAIIY